MKVTVVSVNLKERGDTPFIGDISLNMMYEK